MRNSVSGRSAIKARPMMVLTLLAVFAVVAVGCGGGATKSAAASASSTSPTTGSAPAGTGAASIAAYTQCMTSHGIPASALPQGRTGPAGGAAGGSAPPANGGTGTRTTPSLPPGITQAQYQAARQACRSKLPSGAFGGFGGANTAQVAAYRNCLQLHGVTLPTGRAGGAGQPPASNQAPTSTAGTAPRAGGFGGLNTSDPTVQAALAACASLRPTPTTSTTAA